MGEAAARARYVYNLSLSRPRNAVDAIVPVCRGTDLFRTPGSSARRNPQMGKLIRYYGAKNAGIRRQAEAIVVAEVIRDPSNRAGGTPHPPDLKMFACFFSGTKDQ